MMNPLDQVKERLANASSKRSLHEDTILYIFGLLRQHLDLTPSANAPTVRHYANWIAHPTLTRPPTPSILDEATDVFGAPSEVWYNDLIIQTFRLKELRQEIRTLLAGHPSSELFDSRRFWRWFLGYVFKALHGKTMERTNPPKNKIAGLYIQSLGISFSDEVPGKVMWIAHVMPKDVKVTGPLAIPESQGDFLAD